MIIDPEVRSTQLSQEMNRTKNYAIDLLTPEAPRKNLFWISKQNRMNNSGTTLDFEKTVWKIAPKTFNRVVRSWATDIMFKKSFELDKFSDLGVELKTIYETIVSQLLDYVRSNTKEGIDGTFNKFQFYICDTAIPSNFPKTTENKKSNISCRMDVPIKLFLRSDPAILVNGCQMYAVHCDSNLFFEENIIVTKSKEIAYSFSMCELFLVRFLYQIMEYRFLNMINRIGIKEGDVLDFDGILHCVKTDRNRGTLYWEETI